MHKFNKIGYASILVVNIIGFFIIVLGSGFSIFAVIITLILSSFSFLLYYKSFSPIVENKERQDIS